jgi:hypothetical protein
VFGQINKNFKKYRNTTLQGLVSQHIESTWPDEDTLAFQGESGHSSLWKFEVATSLCHSKILTWLRWARIVLTYL